MWKNNIIKRALFIIMLLMILVNTHAQTGLNFQGVARNINNVILASQPISLRLSIIRTSVNGTTEYSETRKVTTNAQGLFAVVIGDTGAISSLGNFSNIDWKLGPKFLKIEMDVSAGNNFILLGTTQFQSVAYAQFANTVEAEKITGIVPVEKGGTGVNSLASLKAALSIDKNTIGLSNVNNTADTAKPISNATKVALDRKADTADLVLKAPLASPTFTGTVGGITKTMVGLSAIDNTSDLAKPISTATQTALDTKVSTETFSSTITTKENTANKSTATDLGGNTTSDILFPTQKAVKTYVDAQANSGGVADGGITNSKLAEAAVTNDKIASGIDKSKVGLGNVDNTADSLKPISIPVQAALDSKASSIELRSFVKIDTVNRFISEQLFDAGLTTASLTLGGGTRIESGINSETTLFNRSGADFIINTTAISGNDTPTSSSWIFKSDGALSFDNLFSLKFDPIVEEFNLTSEKNIGLVSNNDSLRLYADKEISILGNQSVGISSFNNVFIGTGLIQDGGDGGQILPKNLWRFDEEGNLELPNETKIETGTITETVIRNRPNSDFIINTTAISGNNTPTSSSWEFSPSGTLTLPDNSTIGTNDSVFSIVGQNGIYFNGGGVQNESGRWGEIFISPIQSRGNVFITSTREGNTASPTTSYWSFGASVFDSTINSILTFPDGSEIGPKPYPLDDSIDPVFGITGVNGIVLTGIQVMGPSNMAIIGISPSYWFNNNFEIDTVDTHGNFYIATSYLDDDEDTQVVNNWKFGNDGILTFPDGTTLAGNYSGSTYFELNTYESNGVKITTNSDPNPRTWIFDKSGVLTLPLLENAPSPGTLQVGAFAVANPTSWDPLDKSGTEAYPVFYNGYNWVEFGTGVGSGNSTPTSIVYVDPDLPTNFNIFTADEFGAKLQFYQDGIEKEWSYNTDGSLTFPDGTITSGSISGTSNFGFDTRASESNFSIITGTSTSIAQWTFGTDGVLNLPAGGDIWRDGKPYFKFITKEFIMSSIGENPIDGEVDYEYDDPYIKIPLDNPPTSINQLSIYIDGKRFEKKNRFYYFVENYRITSDGIEINSSAWSSPGFEMLNNDDFEYYYRITIDYFN